MTPEPLQQLIAEFDALQAGSVDQGPGSAHLPTATGVRAPALDLLPPDAIHFTRV